MPPVIAGTVALSRTYLMSPSLPRGMKRSRYSFSLIICSTTARSVSVTNCTASGVTPAASNPSFTSPASAALEWMASLPPRSTAALPDFKQSAAMSVVTLGRLSYTQPITPSGTRRRSILIPFPSVRESKLSPTGSGSRAIARRSFAMPVSRDSLRISRPRTASLSPDSRPASMSSAFASMIEPWFASSASAMARSAASFWPVESFRNSLAAPRAASALPISSVVVVAIAPSATGPPCCCGGPPRRRSGDRSVPRSPASGPLESPGARQRGS